MPQLEVYGTLRILDSLRWLLGQQLPSEAFCTHLWIHLLREAHPGVLVVHGAMQTPPQSISGCAHRPQSKPVTH